jgi:two-component system, chemotaxis family, response regulator PixG
MNNDLQYSTAVDPQHNAIGRLQYLNWGEFSGVIDISVASGQAWEIVFYQGQIAWGLDRSQPNRLWKRLLNNHLGYKHIELDLLFQAANHQKWAGFEGGREVCWQYQGIIALMLLSEVKATEISMMLMTAARETIFDLLQYSQGQKLTFQSQPEIFAERPPILLDTKAVIAQAEVMWQEWHAQKLDNISPHKTPVIKHPVQLYRQTTPIIYQNLVQVITGKRTLIEIAIEIDEDLLLLTRSLTRYIQTGIVELIDLPDLPSPHLTSNQIPAANQTQSKNRFMVKNPSQPPKPIRSKLVICIDDSTQVCERMRSIITDAGYRFIAIQDATQALPRLLENKPDLIFLDLMMPKINGYEICGQIRRISALGNTPIVILTGKDGLLDRVRSKVVGASDFICKPIAKQVIVDTMNKYVGNLVRE